MIKEVLIPAGGLGIRLREVTRDEIPKPLVEVAEGVTMLDLTIKGLRQIGIETIVISLAHLAYQIEEYIEGKYGDWHLDVIHEEGILGTGASIRNFIQAGQNRPFLMAPADNYVTWDRMQDMLGYAGRIMDDVLVVWSTTTDARDSQVPNNVWSKLESGLVVATTSGKQTEEEKQAIHDLYQDRAGYINSTSTGVLAINDGRMMRLTEEDKPPYCIYKDLLPRWTEQGEAVYLYLTDARVIDMGTPDRLEIVRQILTVGEDCLDHHDGR